MAWIESHQELARHPKTKKFARLLNISLPAAVGHLHFFWWWAMDYAQDGDLSKFDEFDIADACGWEGDAAALMSGLINSGFIDSDDAATVIHDWFDYAGRLVEQREKNRERKRKSRARHAPVTKTEKVEVSDGGGGHGATIPNLTIPNQTIQNHNNNIENPSKSLSFFSSEFILMPSSFLVEQLNALVDEFTDEWVLNALKVSLTANKRDLRYVSGILKRWRENGLNEPWSAESKQQPSPRNKGKPQIPTVVAEESEPISEEELAELRKLAKKFDDEGG